MIVPFNISKISLNIITYKHASALKQSNPNKNFSQSFENYDQKNSSKSICFMSTDQVDQQNVISTVIANQMYIADNIDTNVSEDVSRECSYDVSISIVSTARAMY
jgi:hypothetical protein